MDEQISSKISEWIDFHKEEILSDLKKIVDIPSISNPDSEIKPYGKACREVLDFMLAIASSYGYDVQNYLYHVGGIFFNHSDAPLGRIGIWSHLDVVPTGDNWSFPPFSLTEKDGFLIGRGVQDNKCAAIGVLHAFRCIKELCPALNYEYILYVGCSEENTMDDVKFFASHYDQPDLSLVADCGFPVCYGEKGIADICFTCKKALPDSILDFYAGTSSNTIPDTASITLKLNDEAQKCLSENWDLPGILPDIQISRRENENSVFTITAKGVSAHVIEPQKGKNSIYLLMTALKALGLAGEKESWFDFLLKISADGYGNALGIACSDTISGALTGTATRINFSDGFLNVHANYRYPIFEGDKLSDGSTLMKNLEERAGAHGFSMKIFKNSKPSYYNPDSTAVVTLTQTFNQVTGLDTKAYTMSGGSYARQLENAVAFGMSMPGKTIYKEYDGDPRGDYHQANESLNIKEYLKAIEIYTQCILELDRQQIGEKK